MRFDSLSPAARALWAKSGEPTGHGLLAHMLDVAAVAERLLERESLCAMERLCPALWAMGPLAPRAIAALVGLHDLGKACAGFQAKWPQGQLADEAGGLPFPRHLLSVDQHDLVSAFELRHLLTAQLGEFGPSLAQSVAAHHGCFFSSRQLLAARRPGEPASWRAARAEIFDGYWASLSPDFSSLETGTLLELPAIAWLAGLTSVSDWIGSNIDWFAPGEHGDTLQQHHAQALARADAALDQIGWPACRPLLQGGAGTDELLARVVGRPSIRARPLQAAADHLLGQVQEPALLIVEAPMGEGKTELALLAHLRLQQRFGHRGLYLALPTQATGNAMFERALQFLRAFDPGIPLDIQLAHGGAFLDERLVELREVHGEAGDHVRSSAWFSQRKRALLSPYGVGTIDQALLATLNVRHHFVRLWGLSNRVVVLDEVHAYDTYTSGLIDALLAWLKALGCSVVLMSATLPRRRRDQLLQCWGTRQPAAVDLPYPRLLAVSAGDLLATSFASREQAPIEVLALDESLDSLADQAATLLQSGGCGAVVVNTVDRAQKLFLNLKARLDEQAGLMIFHARFPADERTAHEQTVLRVFGKSADRPSQALLIATQVVEQSLDIDFDFLISDLAPVDLLLQRAGRLHRHDRVRPVAHQQARLYVAGLLAHRRPELKETAWDLIYDPWLLGRTWAFASVESRWHLPQDIDRLVQTVYGTQELPAHVKAADRDFIEVTAYGDHCARLQTERQLAQNAALHADEELQNAYAHKPGSEEGNGLGASNQTRLGDDTVTVVPVHVIADDRWCIDPSDPPFDPAIKPDIALARRLLQRQVRLSRKAVVRALQAIEPPAGFQDHPWLRDVRPLRLQGGMLALGKLKVVVDAEIGIVYRHDDTAGNQT